MSKVSCGIDFGTTNSAISIAMDAQAPRLVRFADGKNIMPTAIFYPEEAAPLYGNAAVDAYIGGQSGRFMRSMKRILGSDLMNSDTKINGKMVSFYTILRQFITQLKTQAENFCGQPLEKVVMGRPVHFRIDDAPGDIEAEKQLRQIAVQSGFKEVEFQFEPIAAAYAHEVKLRQERLALIVDVGGGTSDFSIIKIGPARQNKPDRSDDILASSGVRIGGNDFDKDLSLKCFMPALGYGTLSGGIHQKDDKTLPLATTPYITLSEWSKVNSMYCFKEINFVKKMLYSAREPQKVSRLLELVENEKGHNLLAEVEKSKIFLTGNDEHRGKLFFLSDAPEITASKTAFETAIFADVEKIRRAIAECLRLAQIRPDEVQMIILTGGSTEIPLVQQSVKSIFPAAEVSEDDKLASVGLGLAYDSRRRFA